jgi:coenzyme F420-0:L-glutamate ligase/coenzyme F420-1:gamma-L-glutamate ligase
MTGKLELIPVHGIGEIRAGDDLAQLIAEAAARDPLRDGDVVVVTQKVVSKAEDRLVPVDPDDPASRAAVIAAESVRVLRRRGDLVIVETTHGFVCANAGVDLSNIDDGWAALLPVDPDRSARRIRDGLRAKAGVEVAVIISDTFGRTWRQGVTDVAIGSAGIGPILDLRGTTDERGRELQATEIAIVDEIAGAADLVMGKASAVPVAIVRGVDPTWFRRGDVRSEIVRPPEEDLFR